MRIAAQQNRHVKATTPTAAPPQKAPSSPKEDPSWRESVGAELLELYTRWHKDDVDTLAKAARDAGNSLKGVWSSLKGGVAKALGLSVVRENISEDTRQTLTRIAETTAYSVGYTAAGVMGLAAFTKLRSGLRRGDRARLLDGMANLAAGVSIAVSVAGLGPARAILAPLAAALGVASGGANAATGYASHQTRQEIQGVLDGTRSFGTLCRLGSAWLAPLGLVAAVVGPVAAGIQASRGLHDLRTGLREANNKKELNGLADLGVALGTTLALTGVGTIPGVVLTVACSAVKVAYQLHKGSRRRLDRVLDRLEPAMRRGLRRMERTARPLTRRLGPLHRRLAGGLARSLSRPLPWRKGSQPSTPREGTPANRDAVQARGTRRELKSR